MGHILLTKQAEPGPEKPRDDHATTDAGPGLDDQLRVRVAWTSHEPGCSWTDQILGSLVAGAVQGEIRSLHEVFDRIGAAPASKRHVATCSIDDATARKVLEAVRGPINDRSVA